MGIKLIIGALKASTVASNKLLPVRIFAIAGKTISENISAQKI
jgi:hypothetical protein